MASSRASHWAVPRAPASLGRHECPKSWAEHLRPANRVGSVRISFDQPPEDYRVLKTGEHVGSAPEQGQHALHFRIRHLRAAHLNVHLQCRQLHRGLIFDENGPLVIIDNFRPHEIGVC